MPQIVAKVIFVVKDIFVEEAADVKSLGNLYMHNFFLNKTLLTIQISTEELCLQCVLQLVKR